MSNKQNISTIPDESKKYYYTLHAHIRGRSIHGDLRIQDSDTTLRGWTLFIPKGLSRDPTSVSDAQSLYDKEIKSIVVDKFQNPNTKWNCILKKTQPIEWLNVKGEVKPGEIGACLDKNAYVLTNNGWTKIINVTTNDLVFSSDGLWHKVKETLITKDETRNCYQISGQMMQSIIATENHKFLLGRFNYQKTKENTNGKSLNRKVVETKWFTSKEMNKLSLHQLEKWKMIIPRSKENKKNIIPKNKITSLGMLIGFILGDGYLRKQNGHVFELYFNKGKEGRLARYYEHLAQELGYKTWLNRIRYDSGFNKNIKTNTIKQRKNSNIDEYLKPLPSGVLEICVKSKYLKSIVHELIETPMHIYNYPKDFADAIYQGLLDADGYCNHITQKKQKVNTLMSLAIHHADRLINCKTDPRTNALIYNGLEGRITECGKYLWNSFKVKKVDSPENTYNLTVSDTENYIIMNGISHNTKHETGFFLILEKGIVEYGAQKLHHHEYFFQGKLINGKMTFRKLPNKEQWTKTPEGTYTWMGWPSRNAPYVLTPRSIKTKYDPGYQKKAIPKQIASKIPKLLQYWNYKNEVDRTKARILLIKAIRKQEVPIQKAMILDYDDSRMKVKFLGTKYPTSESSELHKKNNCIEITTQIASIIIDPHQDMDLTEYDLILSTKDTNIIDSRKVSNIQIDTHKLNNSLCFKIHVGASTLLYSTEVINNNNIFNLVDLYLIPTNDLQNNLFKSNLTNAIKNNVINFIFSNYDNSLNTENELELLVRSENYTKGKGTFMHVKDNDEVLVEHQTNEDINKILMPKNFQKSNDVNFEYKIIDLKKEKDTWEIVGFAPGIWNNLEFSKEVIQEAPSATGINVVRDHSDDIIHQVGKVIDSRYDEKLKGMVIKFKITNPEVNKQLETKQIRGISMRVFTDSYKDNDGVEHCSKIFGWGHASLIMEPACDVCTFL